MISIDWWQSKKNEPIIPPKITLKSTFLWIWWFSQVFCSSNFVSILIDPIWNKLNYTRKIYVKKQHQLKKMDERLMSETVVTTMLNVLQHVLQQDCSRCTVYFLVRPDFRLSTVSSQFVTGFWSLYHLDKYSYPKNHEF